MRRIQACRDLQEIYLIHSQVYRYLIDNKILTPRQFGFRPKLSTEIALAHFTDTILTNMDKGLVIGAVFLDLAILLTIPFYLKSLAHMVSPMILSTGSSHT